MRIEFDGSLVTGNCLDGSFSSLKKEAQQIIVCSQKVIAAACQFIEYSWNIGFIVTAFVRIIDQLLHNRNSSSNFEFVVTTAHIGYEHVRIEPAKNGLRHFFDDNIGTVARRDKS
jgi:hypothetical protein